MHIKTTRITPVLDWEETIRPSAGEETNRLELSDITVKNGPAMVQPFEIQVCSSV